MEVLNQLFFSCHSGLGKVALRSTGEQGPHLSDVSYFPQNLVDTKKFGRVGFTSDQWHKDDAINYNKFSYFSGFSLFEGSPELWEWGVVLDCVPLQANPVTRTWAHVVCLGGETREREEPTKGVSMCWLQPWNWAQSHCRASEEPWRARLGSAPAGDGRLRHLPNDT